VSSRKRLFVLVFALFLFVGCSFNRNNPGAGITLEVAVFEGGYGIEWHKSVAREYEKLHPGIHVNLWGDPRVDEKLKPRILRRDPPDIANSNLPVWKLIVAGKLYPLDQELNSPAYGQNCTWRQSLIPGVLSDFTYRGHVYAMPTNLNAWVCWYDKRQFRLHGWQPPHTWSEFLTRLRLRPTRYTGLVMLFS
jgi:N-acetylglucosamine transport system substrate-binding protein